jgi:hypothetical protein
MNILIPNFLTFYLIDIIQFGFKRETILVTFGVTSDGPAVWCRADHKNTQIKEN